MAEKHQYGIDVAMMDRQVKDGVMVEAIDMARGVLCFSSDDTALLVVVCWRQMVE